MSRPIRRLQPLTLLLAVAGFAIGCGCFAVNTRVQRTAEWKHTGAGHPSQELRQPVVVPAPVPGTGPGIIINPAPEKPGPPPAPSAPEATP